MQIQCKAKINMQTLGAAWRARLQAWERGDPPEGVNLHFSTPAEKAPALGQEVTVTIEWEAPTG